MSTVAHPPAERLSVATEPAAASTPHAPMTAAQLARTPLGQRLISANLIAPQELETALSHQAENGQRLGEALLDLGFVSEEELLPFIESQLGVPAIRLREGLLDPVAVRLLPRKFAERLGAIALFRVRSELTIATDDPLDLDKLDRIEAATGLTVRAVF